MSPVSQTSQGKAYEYACLLSLEGVVRGLRPVAIVENSSLVVARAAWESLGQSTRNTMQLSSAAGIKALVEMEPKIIEDGTDTLELALQEDRRGQEGDVRDLIIIRRQISWEIGISIKHNHEAIKHSRISPNINFGREWLGLDCTHQYFEEIQPVFARLDALRNNGSKWGEVSDKETGVYIPLLQAFMSELARLNDLHPNIVPSKLLEYLLGRKDFYKIISNDHSRSTILQCFNLHGSLNTASTQQMPNLRARNVNLPTQIYHLDFKRAGTTASRTTVQLVMDNNWAITFRIHNASTLVENSLKFDIQLSGVPASLFTNSVSW